MEAVEVASQAPRLPFETVTLPQNLIWKHLLNLSHQSMPLYAMQEVAHVCLAETTLAAG